MTVAADTLVDFAGKQVILHLITPEGLKELEGKVEDASEVGMAFKEKGKRDVELVEPHQIEEINLAPEKPKTLAQKKLKPVTENTARQHLLDRHGYERSVVNGMTDSQGLAEHDDIDHADLGHKHVEPDNDSDDDETGADEE